MSFKLLPKSTEEFSDAKFWEGFFKTRGSKAFEWYGEYQDMVDLWAQYVKSGDRVLNIGCGNSELGAQLHDLQGCEVLCIDTSATVVQQMARKHPRRPRLTYQKMDAARLEGLADSSFACAVDKGTLDALMSAGGTADGSSVVDAMLAETHRVLRVGGRHIIVSLCQQQVVDKLLEHITARPWIVRVHEATAVSAASSASSGSPAGDTSAGFPLPVFFIALTKLRPGTVPLVQVRDAYSTGPPDRLDSVDQLPGWIRRAQLAAYALAAGSSSDGSSGSGKYRSAQFAYTDGRTGLPAFACCLLTHASPSKRRAGYAVFIEPLPADPADAFTPERRCELLESQATLRRLLFVRLHPWLHYESDAALQASLSRLVMAFAPRPGMPESQVPFLSTGRCVYPYSVADKRTGCLVEEAFNADDDAGHRLVRLVCPNSDLSPLQCHAVLPHEAAVRRDSPSCFARLLDAFVADAADGAVAFVNWPCDIDCLRRLLRPMSASSSSSGCCHRPSPTLHSTASSAAMLALLSERLGGLAFESRLPTSPCRLIVLFPPVDSLAAYAATVSTESIASLADVVDADAGGRLLVASSRCLFVDDDDEQRPTDEAAPKSAAAAATEANAALAASLRRCGRFTGVACASLDEAGVASELSSCCRRYWIACASASAASAARAAELLDGMSGVRVLDNRLDSSPE